jgi:hypothetical protein
VVLDFHIWAREIGFAYGREIPLPDGMGRLAVGAGGFPFDPSEVRASVHGPGTKIASSRGESKLGSIRLGVLYEPVEQVAVGAQYTHIRDWLRASFPGVGGFTDRYGIHLFTVGAAVKPDDKTVIAVQHLFGNAHGDTPYGHLDNQVEFDYFSVGAERLVPITEEVVLALRAGLLRGELTCGVGCTLPHGFRIDYAYMAHSSYDLRNEFGTARLHVVGVGKEF